MADGTPSQPVTFNVHGTEEHHITGAGPHPEGSIAARNLAALDGEPTQLSATTYLDDVGEENSDYDWARLVYEIAQFIIDNNEELGRLLSVVLGGVSNIKRIINLTDQPVELWKIDKKWFQPTYQTAYVEPGGRYDMEMWIPWADDQNQYNEHHMTIKVGTQIIAYIWQNGPLIRFSTIPDTWVAGAPGVPGQESSVGGERTLGIGARYGTPGFVIVGYEG
jgi:hypothetical protein